jgi:hypothetical protein
MLSKSAQRIWEFLNQPLFGTKVIPRNARVDASLFSEEEFPVYCPKCKYQLRGLPDSRCPECGEPFERGRLLVLQYVHGPKEPENMWLTMLLQIGLFTGFAISTMALTTLDRDWLTWLSFVFGTLLFVVSLYYFVSMFRKGHNARKRQEIIKQISG